MDSRPQRDQDGADARLTRRCRTFGYEAPVLTGRSSAVTQRRSFASRSRANAYLRRSRLALAAARLCHGASKASAAIIPREFVSAKPE